MPTYDFINKKTGEIVELTMSMTVLDKYKEDNPDMERYFGNQKTSAEQTTNSKSWGSSQSQSSVPKTGFRGRNPKKNCVCLLENTGRRKGVA